MALRRLWMVFAIAVAAGACGDASVSEELSRPSGPFVVVEDVYSPLGFSVASGDDGFLVAFVATADRDETDVLAVRLSRSGEVVSPDPIRVSDASRETYLEPETVRYGSPAVSFDGRSFGVGFSGHGVVRGVDSGLPGVEILYVGLSPEYARGAEATIATQEVFSMAFSSLGGPSEMTGAAGGHALVYEARGGGAIAPFSVPRGVFVFDDGMKADERGIGGLMVGFPVSEEIFRSGSSPSVASGTERTLVVWIESQAEIAAQRFETYVQGAWVGPGTIASRVRLADVPTTAGATAVASDGDGFLVLWTTATSEEPSVPNEIWGLEHSLGAAPSAPFLVAGGPAAKGLGGVAYAGGSYLVVWREDGAVLGARVGSNADVAPPVELDPGPISGGVAVVANGDSFLLVFPRHGLDDSSTLYGSFVDAR